MVSSQALFVKALNRSCLQCFAGYIFLPAEWYELLVIADAGL